MYTIVAELKTLITSSDEAKKMGKWDAEHGKKCNAEAYEFAGENNVVPTRFRGDYTYAYITAKGL